MVTRNAPNAELLKGHWGVPLARIEPTDSAIDAAAALARESLGVDATCRIPLEPIRHSITYRRLVVVPVPADLTAAPSSPHRLLEADRVTELPALYRKILSQAESL